MPPSDLVSVVIPAYNPTELVAETIASVQRQTHREWEIILVDDGTDRDENRAVIDAIERRASPRLRVIRQENRGLAGARNAGFEAARGAYVIPLDADDLLEPEMIEVCLSQMQAHPDAGFAYFDYRVFGDDNYIEHPGEYNFYRLLDENFMAYCCFVPRQVWSAVGGYDGWHHWGYEDWSFFLNLGKHGYWGHYIHKPLFRYRTHGRGLHFIGLDRHDSNWAHMGHVHPEVLTPEGRLRVKREWAPSICFLVQGERIPSLTAQTVQDYQVLLNASETEALARSRADAFLWVSGDQLLQPRAAEECIWGLTAADWVSWNDTGDAPPPSLAKCAGPLGVSRAALSWPEPKRSGEVRRLPWRCLASPETLHSKQRHAGAGGAAGDQQTRGASEWLSKAAHGSASPADPSGASRSRTPVAVASSGETVAADDDRGVDRGPSRTGSVAVPPALDRVYHHLRNADLLSADAWLKHPLRMSARLLPLRFKEKVNRISGNAVFDLSFYLKFQPRSVLLDGMLIKRLDYIAPVREPGRRRVGLCTPHLGVGGAETVLLEFAREIDRSANEVLLIATHSSDSRLLPEWRNLVDHVYDMINLVPMEQGPRFLYSLAVNWQLDLLVIQNSPAAYSILPALKKESPDLQVIDILHAVEDDWDFFSATLEVADLLDRRIVISEAGRQRLLDMATREDKIRLIRNGVDLQSFRPDGSRNGQLHRRLGLAANTDLILFVGRLDPVKRPLLVPEIAKELERLSRRPKGGPDFQFVVAGDGPEADRLRAAIESQGLQDRITLLGYVSDVAAVLAEASLLILPSEAEGIPLSLLEALAMEVPVVACRAGAIEEALPTSCGVLVEPGADEEIRFAEAIDELLRDTQRRAAMGRAGRSLVEREYSLDRARTQYREVLADLTAEAVL